MKLISNNIHKIRSLCERFKVARMYVFGSILTPRFNEESDVDLLFSFEKEVTYHTYADLFFGLQGELEKLFGRRVDLVDEEGLKNKYFIREVNQTRQLILGTEG
ncbi:MAG: nucleotidyltransferase domain-containing protein [Muribaculaceae bacterium]|nr:nucleotidyltransferase domain-containing protein [Muribaculaceae bacterium]